MAQQPIPAHPGGDSQPRHRSRWIIFVSFAVLALIGGLVLLCIPGTDSHQSVFDRVRRGFDEHRRTFDQRRRAWEEQRRAEEQAKRAAATAASQKADPAAPAGQSTNP